ncbi:extracellular solute-binding protein [Alkalihalobacillus sp. 1P02AB]|uniref:extracellular solute-binding protein n=1 Tax=Alkalihalobacillus sp. 1P02AB TaxID=3132260 RepID=UPI0039A40520
MKKSLMSFLGLVLAMFVLTACSGGAGEGAGGGVEVPEGATEVVLWNLFGGGDAEYMQEIVEEFNNSQDGIFINNVLQDYDEYYTKLLTSVASGKGPDLAISHTHVLPELVNQGLLQELDTLGLEVGITWDDFNRNILEATIYDEKHYAVPIDTHAHIFYVNNKLVGDAGLLNEDGTVKMEQTPDGFREFFTTLKEELPDDKFPLAFSTAGVDSYRHWWSYYTQLGGEHILTEDLENPEYVLDVDKAIEAAEYLYNLWHEDEVIPLNLADFYAEFQSENSASIATGVWATGIWETTEELEFTAMPLPNIFGQEGAWGDSHTFVIPYYQSADTEVQKAALEFMDFATEKGAIWAKAGHIPAKDTVVESVEYQELPYRSEYAQVANYVNFPDRTIYARGVQDIMIRNLDLIWTNEVSPEEAFNKIEQEVASLIGR